MGTVRHQRAAAYSIAALILLTLTASVVAPARAQDSPKGDAYQLGVFPFDPPALIRKRFQPVAKAFSEALRRPVALRTKTSFAKFTDELAKQSYDIVFVQPFDFVAAEDRFDYLPLARAAKPIFAVLVARTDDASSFDPSLRTGLVATLPRSAAVTRLFWLALADKGLKPGQRVDGRVYRTHSACLHAVLISDADACVTAPVPLRLFQKRSGVTTREILRTTEIPGSLFAVHRRVAEQDREHLRASILSWGDTAAGKRVLAATGQIEPFIDVQQSDYDTVRRLLAHEK